MRGGRYQGSSPSSEVIPETTGQQVSSAFVGGVLAPLELLPMPSSNRRSFSSEINDLQYEANNRGMQQGWGQEGATWLAGMAGAVISPVSLAFGAVGGSLAAVGARGAMALGSRYLPEAAASLLSRPISEVLAAKSVTNIIGKAIPKGIAKQSIGQIAKNTSSVFSNTAGFSLPSEVAERYNAHTDKFNWAGGVTAALGDGGIGVAMMAAPYAIGTIFRKIRGAGVSHVEMPLPGESSKSFNISHVDDAVEAKRITPEEGSLMKDYLTKSDSNKNIAARATKMLMDQGHPADAATHKVWFSMLSHDDVKNVKTGVMNKVAASNIPEDMKDLFIKYVNDNAVDRISASHPSVADGLDGVVNFLRKRLDQSDEEIKSAKSVMREMLPENATRENPFSQAKMHEGHSKGLTEGMTIPSQVRKRIAQEDRVKTLKAKVAKYKRSFDKTGDKKYQEYIARNEKKIADQEAAYEKLLSHKEEMEHIRGKLMPEGKVAENFKASPEYYRLMELSGVKNSARKIINELHIKHAHETQEAYATVLDTMSNIIKSDIGTLAKHENVLNYLKERIKSTIPEYKDLEIADIRKEVSMGKEKYDHLQKDLSNPAERDRIVDDLKDQIEEYKDYEISDEYKEIEDRYNEFKDKPTVFNSLIKCVLGAMDAK